MKKKIFILLLLLSAFCYGSIWLAQDKDVPGQPTAQEMSASIPTDTPEVCIVATGIEIGHVNLRGCEGMACPVLRVLTEGQKLTVVTTGTWYEVIANDGMHGWINSTYCKNGDQ